MHVELRLACLVLQIKAVGGREPALSFVVGHEVSASFF